MDQQGRDGGRCADCGAPLPSGAATCRPYLDDLLAIEWQIPGGPGERAHFLAVSTFNLQHPAPFGPEHLAGLRRNHAAILDEAMTFDGLRRFTRAGTDGAGRVLRRDVSGRRLELGAPRTPTDPVDPNWPRRWAISIADVLNATPADYADRVEAWAVATRATLDRALDPAAAPAHEQQRSRA